MLHITYFGSPQISASLLLDLLKLNSQVCIDLVVTQKDKPVGRNNTLTETPVKTIAKQSNIPVYELGVKNWAELDPKSFDLFSRSSLGVVFAYREIIPKSILQKPLYGFWNVHPSLLPDFRGASPTIFPFILGHKETGVSIMQMDEKLDHGKILGQDKFNIDSATTRTSFEEKIPHIALELLKELFVTVKDNRILSKEQDHDRANYSFELKREDGFIDLDLLRRALLQDNKISHEFTPKIISNFQLRNPSYKSREFTPSELSWNMWRGLSPWPGIWTLVKIHGQQKRLKILEVKFNNSRFKIELVQIEAKNPVSFSEFKKAYPEVF